VSSSAEFELPGWNTRGGRQLELQDAISDGQHVLTLRGELDMASASELKAALVRVCEEKPRVLTLDLRGLTFIDSTGLQAIIAASQECEKLAAEFRLIPGPPAIQRVFEIVGLIERLPFDPASQVATPA
jgi:anti-anti-sigma factor